MMRAARLPIAAMLLTLGSTGGAQSYRARVDARAQAVSFRGLVQDSIAVALVVPSASGGQETPDGHAVRCGSNDYCFFFRPGEVVRGIPVTTSASITMWGLGAEGLSLHATGRVISDLGPDRVWPGTEPSVQLLEGYVEYQRSRMLARGGRQLVASRLEPVGFDGGWVRGRWQDGSLELAAYGGLGLGQAASVVVTSPALNPLDEWRPRDRQLVAGLDGAWLYRNADFRVEYRREIDPQNHYFVSERTALSVAGRIGAALRASGGIDYNIAEGHPGTADLLVTYPAPRFTVSAGARRYVPYFSLWTLWGAFSPVPYTAVNASGQFRANKSLSLQARAERYRYDAAEVSTAVVPHLTDGGWRASASTTALLGEWWTADVNYAFEHGPGASGRFVDGALTFVASERWSAALTGGSMARPLELRYYDATSRWVGGRAELQLGSQRRVWMDAAFIDDERQRSDASASSLAQLRVRSGVSLAFGSGADRPPLPPARIVRP
jgi:hypothetical protein